MQSQTTTKEAAYHSLIPQILLCPSPASLTRLDPLGLPALVFYHSWTYSSTQSAARASSPPRLHGRPTNPTSSRNLVLSPLWLAWLARYAFEHTEEICGGPAYQRWVWVEREERADRVRGRGGGNGGRVWAGRCRGDGCGACAGTAGWGAHHDDGSRDWRGESLACRLPWPWHGSSDRHATKRGERIPVFSRIGGTEVPHDAVACGRHSPSRTLDLSHAHADARAASFFSPVEHDTGFFRLSAPSRERFRLVRLATLASCRRPNRLELVSQPIRNLFSSVAFSLSSWLCSSTYAHDDDASSAEHLGPAFALSSSLSLAVFRQSRSETRPAVLVQDAFQVCLPNGTSLATRTRPSPLDTDVGRQGNRHIARLRQRVDRCGDVDEQGACL